MMMLMMVVWMMMLMICIVDDDADARCNIFDPVIHSVTHHSPIREGTLRM